MPICFISKFLFFHKTVNYLSNCKKASINLTAKEQYRAKLMCCIKSKSDLLFNTITLKILLLVTKGLFPLRATVGVFFACFIDFFLLFFALKR